MAAHDTYYDINGIEIAWGMPFAEVRGRLGRFEQLRPNLYNQWQYAYYKCSSILGMAATEATISAPFADRPVMRVAYQLSPLEAGFFESFHTPYVKQLEQQLGKAHKKEKTSGGSGLKKEYRSGAVVYSADWWFGNVGISLSVYGGTRHEDNGPCGAGLFIHWYDEITAATPFRTENEAFENLLEKHIGERTAVKKFSIDATRPFAMEHYELDDPYIARKDNNLRAAQMALYTKGLYQTPFAVSEMLDEDEILYYTIPVLNKWFVSTKWDTVYIDPETAKDITYTKLLPGRGPGGHELAIGWLNMRSPTNINDLPELASLIENSTGSSIKRDEWYDE